METGLGRRESPRGRARDRPRRRTGYAPSRRGTRTRSNTSAAISIWSAKWREWHSEAAASR